MIRRLAVVFGLMTVLLVLFAPESQAIDVPGVDVCSKNAPFAHTPQEGLAGLVGERPLKVTTTTTPETVWSTGGFAGMRPYTYDLGCALDPTSWSRVTLAGTESGIATVITDIGNSVVSLTDSVDRRAWAPGWTTTFLTDFAHRSSDVINLSIIGPFMAAGLVLAGLLLLRYAHRGDTGTTANSLGWILLVLTVSTVILATPVVASTWAQRGGGSLVATLNNGQNASDATTNTIVKNVQYQGWLRRTFGSDQTEVGKVYGPRLLASLRVSWAELDAAKTPKARNDLIEAKQKDFETIAAKVKDADPIAYRHLTGEESGAVVALVETTFAVAASFFRLATSLLMIVCTITLVLLAVIWLVLTPILVLSPGPRSRFSGQEIGIGLFNSATRALGYVFGAAIGSYLFGVYLQACLQPGMSLWWSLLLLILGSSIAWTILRPDRKMLEIISLGRVRGYGALGKFITTAAWAYLGGQIAGRVAGSRISDRQEETARMSETIPAASVVYADIYSPAQPFVPETPTHVDGETLPTGAHQRALPYERTAPPAPPDSADSDYTPYERSDDDEGAVL